MGLYEKLINVQTELVAPKSRTNTFGKYSYRTCEDILSAVKPLLKKHGLSLTLSDEIVEIGDRFYVRAMATLWDVKGEGTLSVCAYARESLDKKGMDDAQITGTASSYARKYALNGLFCIDDSQDADVTNTHGKDLDQVISEAMTGAELSEKISEKELAILNSVLTDTQAEWALNAYNIPDLSEMSKAEYGALMRTINDRKNAEEKKGKAGK